MGILKREIYGVTHVIIYIFLKNNKQLLFINHAMCLKSQEGLSIPLGKKMQFSPVVKVHYRLNILVLKTLERRYRLS